MTDNGRPRAIYAIFRTVNLDQALATFRNRFDADPVAIVVNARLINETAAALISVNLDIPVASSGGCLLGELWLQRDPAPAVDCQRAVIGLRQRSLAARVSETQRAGARMTQPEARQLALALTEVSDD